jgi:ABC-type branched-subunit amino acid transport system substrate-binding protein
MKRWYSWKITAVALSMLMIIALLFTGNATSDASTSTINVCGDYSLSGVYAQIGTQDNDGAVAYFKYIDKHGGILGHQVKYSVTDNQSEAVQAALIAKKCVEQDHASWIFGPESGANTLAALPIAIAAKTILISMSSGWQTNGYPTSELNSYGFPANYDVFKQDDIDMADKIIVPRHYTRVALIEDNCGSVCLANKATMEQLAQQDHFKLVSTQIVTLGSTDMTPQVLAMLADKPQIIIFGMVPGTDSITAIKDIRAQSPTLPIGECSQCYLPSFVSAAGGASGMKNVYTTGSTLTDYPYDVANAKTNPVAAQSAASLKLYLAGMKSGGYTNAEVVAGGAAGWDGGIEMDWAINKAGSLDETADMHALQNLKMNALGVEWDRTPQNYENYSEYYAATLVIQPNGKFVTYNG